MNNYKGIIIEESLKDRSLLGSLNITSTKVEDVTEKHKTPWLEHWTLHTVKIPENEATKIAELISQSIDTKHQSWYADFKNKRHHYIIFPNKVFFVDRTKKNEYQKAIDYGVRLGIPEYQLDFSPEIIV